MFNLRAKEPALVGSAITAVLTLAVTFGLHWSAEQIAATATAGTVITGLFVRQAVTPTAKGPAAPGAQTPSPQSQPQKENRPCP